MARQVTSILRLSAKFQAAQLKIKPISKQTYLIAALKRAPVHRVSAAAVLYLPTCPCTTFRLWLRSRERGLARWQLLAFVCAAASFQTSTAWTFFLKLAERKCCRAARQWTVSPVNPAPPPSTLIHSHNFFSTWTDNGKLPARCPASFTCHTVQASISAASLAENIQTRSRGGAEGPGRGW